MKISGFKTCFEETNTNRLGVKGHDVCSYSHIVHKTIGYITERMIKQCGKVLNLGKCG